MAGRLPVLLLLVVLAAGCSGPAADRDAPRDPSVDGEQPDDTSSEGEGAKDTALLRAQAGPDGLITAVKWQVPAGALQTRAPEGDEEALAEIFLAVVPDLPDGLNQSLGAWGLLAFKLDAEATLLDWQVNMPGVTRYTDSDGTEEHERNMLLDPFIWHIRATSVKVGDTLGLVAFAVAPATSPVDLYFWPLDHAPADDETVSGSAAKLRNSTMPLEVVGDGIGVDYSLCQWTRLGPPFGITIEYEGGTYELSDALPEPGTLGDVSRDVTLGATYENAGFVYAIGTYFGYGAGTGTYEVTLDLFGEQTAVKGFLAEDMGYSADGVPDPQEEVTGLPLYDIVAEGDPGFSQQMHIRFGHAGLTAGIYLYSFGLGTTIQDLLGVALASEVTTYASPAGNVPP